jgi:hypothetical protein
MLENLLSPMFTVAIRCMYFVLLPSSWTCFTFARYAHLDSLSRHNLDTLSFASLMISRLDIVRGELLALMFNINNVEQMFFLYMLIRLYPIL